MQYSKGVFQSNYLAPISYYSELLRTSEAKVDVEEYYVKQTLRNRCQIDSPNGVLSLTIPVVNNHRPTPMRDICISDHANWRHQHWNALVSSYRQTPYFEYFADDFAPFYYEKKWKYLIDFNHDIQEVVLRCMDVLEIPVKVLVESLPNRDGGGISYYQMFVSKHGFLPNLSIVDLLFNMGHESILYL